MLKTASLFVWTKHRNVTNRQTDGRTDRHICRGYYSGRHCEQCGRAVKSNGDRKTEHYNDTLTVHVETRDDYCMAHPFNDCFCVQLILSFYVFYLFVSLMSEINKRQWWLHIGPIFYLQMSCSYTPLAIECNLWRLWTTQPSVSAITASYTGARGKLHRSAA